MTFNQNMAIDMRAVKCSSKLALLPLCGQTSSSTSITLRRRCYSTSYFVGSSDKPVARIRTLLRWNDVVVIRGHVASKLVAPNSGRFLSSRPLRMESANSGERFRNGRRRISLRMARHKVAQSHRKRYSPQSDRNIQGDHC